MVIYYVRNSITEVTRMEKKIITDKVEKLDVKGQGCMDDCKHDLWVGNQSYGNGCYVIHYAPTPQTTKWF